MNKKKVLIIGAGPAGLAAGYELLKAGDYEITILEQENQVGGLARTINHTGWRFDIGPHRFFSKSKEVNELWQRFLPGNNLLNINRLTRILYNKKLFSYPISLTWPTIKSIGLKKIVKIGLGYLAIRIRPIRPEISLADFYINRFGAELYKTFFASYTEKVWGKPCSAIPKDWGAQRVKGLSIGSLFRSILFNEKKETSLIDRFFYPKLGAGQFYENLAAEIEKLGGEIILNTKVERWNTEDKKIVSCVAGNQDYRADFFISSMPIKDLLSGFDNVPTGIKEISDNLIYRDIILVILTYRQIKDLKDNWIYIQEPGIAMGRLDIFNNFSVDLIKKEGGFLLGAEYFSSVGDNLWQKNDSDLITLAKMELETIGLAKEADCLDAWVLRQSEAYPAYFGGYNQFLDLQKYLDSFSNLFLAGRNGLHHYNNMDHSILTGQKAAQVIMGEATREEIWQINTEADYHENK